MDRVFAAFGNALAAGSSSNSAGVVTRELPASRARPLGLPAVCRNLHSELLRLDGNGRYTEYVGVGHNCWDRAYGSRDLYNCPLKQRRSNNVRDDRNEDVGGESRKTQRKLGVSAAASGSGWKAEKKIRATRMHPELISN